MPTPPEQDGGGYPDTSHIAALYKIMDEYDGLQELYDLLFTVEHEIRVRDFKPEGYVYVLRSGEHYKIGMTVNPDRRIKQLAIQLPFKVEVVYVIPCEDMRRSEAYFHWLFNDVRMNGEWFKLTDEDMGIIGKYEVGMMFSGYGPCAAKRFGL